MNDASAVDPLRMLLVVVIVAVSAAVVFVAVVDLPRMLIGKPAINTSARLFRE
uniref:Uncharacterized protein n=1 Tax=Setaria digitata TaxID=48799 RepID=A0A915PRF8_9BILA